MPEITRTVGALPRYQKRTSLLRSVAAKALALVVVLVGWVLVPMAVAPANAAGCGVQANPVVCENALPGTAPSLWDINGAGDSSIQGFSTDISANVGSTMSFKIDTNARAYSIAIYRTGWYQGNGARKIADVTPSATLPQTQPQCVTNAATEIYDCGNWGVSASWAVPADAVSGVYFALLTRTDTGGQSQITFIVRDDASHSSVLFQTSDPTWQAYNTYGGSDFYQGAGNGRAYKISYNRPLVTRGDNAGRDSYFGNEYPTVRFLEKNGYDVSYFSGVDTDRFGSLLKNHKVFLSVGHDEYWSGGQRANVEAARDAGVNLQFLSGNEVYWRTRYESAVAGAATPYRTLVSYKETWSNAKIDPTSTWTGTWRDPRFASQPNGAGLPENGLTGTQYQSNFTDLAITVSAAEGKSRLWRNTSLTSLSSGSSAALAAHTIGYESDEDIDNGFRPAGLVRLSTTAGATPQYLTDFGSTVVAGTTTHHVTLYRAPSGALVFSAGTIQWAWGLDQEHDGNGPPADPRMQQAQVNLLADMGASPATLASGLVATSASTDTSAPTATVTSPAAGTSVANGTRVTLTGTAADSGGGIVAGVEVSTDAGGSWHPATGTTSWSYSYVQHDVGSQSIRVRAIDDSGNYPGSPTTLALTVTGPHSIFGAEVPKTADAKDATPVELGVRFTPNQDGQVGGIRFYKSAANTGTHTGSLWSSTGQRLATITFSGESASGWQTATFATPVAVSAGTQYVASYWAPRGHYAADDDAWAYRGVSAAPLVVAGGFGAQPASVYNTNGDYPTDVFGQANYYVDALFVASGTVPPTAGGQSPLPGSSSVPVGTTIGATFSKDADPASVNFIVRDPQGTAVTGTAAYASASRTATFTPAAALATATTYQVTLTARDTTGAALSSGGTWSFTTVRPATTEGACPCSLYDDSKTPAVLAAADNAAVTLGVRFSVAAAGTVSGIKFYKGPGNTGVHTGTLWTAAGTQLGSATFSNESSSGWQSVTFAQPISVSAGTEYVASYRTTVGQYSVSPGAFGTAYTRGPLTAGVNAGMFSYTDSFPGSQTSTDYLVDLIYIGENAPATVTSTSPAAGAVEVPATTAITATLSAAPPAGTPSLAVTSTAGAVAGSSAYNATTRVITFTPAAALTASTQFSAVASLGGTAMSGGSWSFTTAAAGGAQTSYTLLGTLTPAVPAATDDTSPVELGMSFSSSVAGSVTAIRFFKGAGNSGTHTGSLWSSTGQRLATVTFTGETASGWQSAQLGTPVTLTVGQTYVVSYLAPVGRYAYTTNFFTSPLTSGPLTAGTDTNGRFVYGAAGGFPASAWQSSNYFVDVTFSTTTATPPPAVTVTSTTPASNATGVATSAAVTATLSAAPSSGTPTLALSGPAGAVTGTSAYDTTTRVITFTPAAALTDSTQYTAVASLAGTALAGGTWSFTTAAATPPPAVTVTSTTPAANATGVATSAAVTATLSAAPSSGTPALGLSGPAGAVTGTSSYNTATRVITFTPAAALTDSTQYTAVASLAGATLAGGTWSFTTATATPPPAVTVTSTTPASNATGVATSAAVTATLSAAPSSGTPTLALSGPAGAVTGTSAYDTTTRVITFTPATALTDSTQYTAVASLAGTTLAGGTWSFTTAAAGTGTSYSLLDTLTPAVAADSDTIPIELGMSFSSSAPGSVTAIRFYKSTTNTGTHTGSLWSSTGQRLATVTFTGESASGWQTAQLATPVALTVGQTYVVSYFAPVGRYSSTGSYFTTARTVGPLTAGTTTNGRYLYAAGGGFPSKTFQRTNYFVDVVFRTP